MSPKNGRKKNRGLFRSFAPFLYILNYLTNFSFTLDSTRKIGKEQASEGDTCNGDNFLQCYLPGYQQNSAAFSDLADFIECKPGVDYSRWLKNRRRFNKWLQKKRHRLHPIGSDR